MEPGLAFSDLITITPQGERWLRLVSLALRPAPEEGKEESSGSIEDYVRCEGVDLP